jgi:hypothetical protein
MEPRIEDITSGFAASIVDSKVSSAFCRCLCDLLPLRSGDELFSRSPWHLLSQATLPACFDIQWQPVQVQGQWHARGGVAACSLSPSLALFFGGGGRDGSVFNDILLVDSVACTGNNALPHAPAVTQTS